MNQKPERSPRIVDTLRSDLSNVEHYRNIRREYHGLRDFYIDQNLKSRLEKMNLPKRMLFFAWWLLKSMFFKLVPTRRLLIVAGLFFTIQSLSSKSGESGLVGGMIILFVLVLELKDKLLAQDELEAGRTIQNALMPEPTPEVPGWSIWIYTRPANEVGGDLVDFMKIGDARFLLVMGDVSGKGLRAALLAAKLQATVRALASENTPLSELSLMVNAIFHRDRPANMFASLIQLQIRSDSPTVHVVNAGHFPAIKFASTDNQEMPKGDPAIGLSPKTTFTEHTITVESGEFLLIYSDGLTEACNANGEFYGTDRLMHSLSRADRPTAREIGIAVGNELERFVGDAPANDDLSLIILKRL